MSDAELIRNFEDAVCDYITDNARWPVEKLIARRDEARKNITAELAALRARVTVLEGALQFYAEESNYDYDNTCCPKNSNKGDALCDSGQIARAALQQGSDNAKREGKRK